MNKNISSPWVRLLAYLVDFFLMFLPPILFLNIVSSSDTITLFLDRASFSVVFIVFVYPVLYVCVNSFLIKSFGGTVGKIVTGTEIVNKDGSNISFLRAFFRNHVGYMISGVFLWLGFIWIFIDKERRTWHDQIADTYVVTKNKYLAFFGAFVLAFLIFLEFGLISKSVNNFSIHKVIYEDTIRMIVTSLSETSSELD